MSLANLKKQALQHPEVAQEYNRLETEFSLIGQLISMRTKAGLTQEEVATRMHTQKSNISRMERGNANPSWKTLMNYAQACGFQLMLQPVKAHG
jgi:DNA-binding XRE family transcriptional regulator